MAVNCCSEKVAANCWCDYKKLLKDLRGPVEAGDHTMLGPALVHELPVERELCSSLDFTGREEKKNPQKTKQPHINQ